MNSKKTLSWIFIFSVLITYSSFIISGKQINPEIAYAAEIPKQFSNASDSIFIEVQDRLDIWQTILARLRGLAVQQAEMCQVPKSDFAALSKTQSFSVTKESEGGVSVSIAQPDLPLSSSDLALKFPNVHCQLLSIFNQLILQLSSHLS